MICLPTVLDMLSHHLIKSRGASLALTRRSPEVVAGSGTIDWVISIWMGVVGIPVLFELQLALSRSYIWRGLEGNERS